MARVIEGPLPEIFLLPTWTVTFAAIDPTTGNNVPNVKVSDATITGDTGDDGERGSTDSGPFMLVPGPTPVDSAPTTPLPIRGGL